MSKNTKDLRVRRTLRAIRMAFDRLVLEKTFDEISITELTELAMINRKTFYLHYSSLDDLITEIEEDVAEKIALALQSEADTMDVAGCIRRFYYYMEDCDVVERRLLSDPAYRFFYEKVTETVLSREPFTGFYKNAKYPAFVKAYCAAITTIYRSWTGNGRKEPLDDVIDYACQLLLHGYDAVKPESDD